MPSCSLASTAALWGLSALPHGVSLGGFGAPPTHPHCAHTVNPTAILPVVIAPLILAGCGKDDESDAIITTATPASIDGVRMAPAGLRFDVKLVSQRVRVYWEAEDEWFAGEVHDFDPSDDTHTVHYDDGDVQR